MSETSTGDVVAAAATAATTGNWRRAGIAGAAIGVIAAGAAAGVAIERLTVGRGMRQKARLALDASGPYGSLRGTPGKAVADDGTELYYEVDEVDPEAGRARAAAGSSAARPRAPVTVVFSHGYCLSQDSWHFQRAALRGLVRTVHWDQRSHGRSGARRAPRRTGRRAGHHRPAGPRPEGGHRRGRARGPAGAGRPLHGRHDDHGARRPVPRADPRAGRRRRLRRHVVAGSSARSTSGCRSRA